MVILGGGAVSYEQGTPVGFTAMCLPLGENLAHVIVPPSFAHVMVLGFRVWDLAL